MPHFSNNEPNHSCDDNQIIRSLIELGFKVNEPMSQMVRFDLDEEFGNLYFLKNNNMDIAIFQKSKSIRSI